MKYCLDVDELDRLPEKGMDVETVLKEAKSILGLGDGDWKTGSESGTVYNGGCFFKTNFPIWAFKLKEIWIYKRSIDFICQFTRK